MNFPQKNPYILSSVFALVKNLASSSSFFDQANLSPDLDFSKKEDISGTNRKVAKFKDFNIST